MSSKPVIDIYTELKSLFQYCPPIQVGILPSPRSDSSRTSASPPPPRSHPLSFYDLHLGERFVLKHVELLPSLTRDLAAVAEQALASRKGDDGVVHLPAISGGNFVMSSLRMRKNIDALSRLVLGPDGVLDAEIVANFYKSTTANYCTSVASTLAIHPTAPAWLTVIDWTRDQTRPIDNYSYALEDGALRLLPHFRLPAIYPIFEGLSACLDDKTHDTLCQVGTRFPAIANWHIYGSSSEDEGILRTIGTVSGDFSAVTCQTSRYPRREATFAVPPNDAIKHPWHIAGSVSSDPAITKQQRSLKPKQKPPAMPTRRSERLKTRDTAKASKLPLLTRVRKTPSKLIPTPSSAPSLGAALPVTIRDDADASEDQRSRYVIQHLWAEATRKDTSLFVVHNGKFERIFLRHRKSQTLYVSELIDVHNSKNPAYGQLQVGLYMAALQDAMDRAIQLSASSKEADEGAVGGTSRKHPEDDGGNDIRGKRKYAGDGPKGKAKSTRRSKRTQNNLDKMLNDITSRDLALIYLQHGVYDSPVPASCIRSQPPPLSDTQGIFSRKETPSSEADDSSSKEKAADILHKTVPLKKNYHPDEYISLILGDRIGYGATGAAHVATLEIQASDGRHQCHPVIVKLAFSASQQKSLVNEYHCYHYLAAAGVTGIVHVMGLFNDIEGLVSALVMTHGGRSLHARAEVVQPPQREAFKATLRAIHEAGFLHGDIRTQNLLINDAGDIAIIDFNGAQDLAADEDAEHEMGILCEIIDQDEWK